jgi:hypothetical protein
MRSQVLSSQLGSLGILSTCLVLKPKASLPHPMTSLLLLLLLLLLPLLPSSSTLLLLLLGLLLQAEGPQEPAQEAPRQVCAGRGAAQGPGAGHAGGTRQCTRLCRRGDRHQVTGGQEHALGLELVMVSL